MGLDFCAIDFETANPSRGSVCAVGLVRVRGGDVVQRAFTYVRPPAIHDWFAPANVRVHRIGPDHVTRAPMWTQVCRDIVHFVAGDVLVAHNAPFETSVLRQASEAEGLDPPALELVCSLAMARALYPTLPKHRLPDLAQHCGVAMGQHHDALADADASARVVAVMTRGSGHDCLSAAADALSLRRYRPDVGR